MSMSDVSVSAGASGCILGVFGGLAVVNLRYWTHLPLGFRQPKRWWVFIIAINAALPILFPVIDVLGHLGGLAVGALVTFLVLDRSPEPKLAPPAGPVLRSITFAVAAMFAVGVVTAIYFVRGYNTQREYQYTVELATAALHEDPVPASDNQLAWVIALYPGAKPAALQVAEQIAQRAVDHSADVGGGLLYEIYAFAQGRDRVAWENSMGFKDTLATVWYRQGRVDEAARLELSQVEAAPAGVDLDTKRLSQIWSQLERLLAARDAALGPLASIDLDKVHLDIERNPNEPPKIGLTVDPKLRTSFSLYVLARRSGKPLGLLRVQAGPGEKSHATHTPGTDLILSKDVRFTIAAASPGAGDLAAGTVQWDWHPTDPEVADYP